LCGFVADYIIYAILVSSDVSVYVSNGIGFVIGTVVNVVLIRRFVFKNSRFSLSTDLNLTLMSNGSMLVLGMGVLWLLVEHLGISPYWAKLIVNGLTFVINYIIRAIFFRKK